jgi:hypothetical protein
MGVNSEEDAFQRLNENEEKVLSSAFSNARMMDKIIDLLE